MSDNDQVYVVVDWNDHYESSQSRRNKSLTWLRVPNRFDGDRISTLIKEGGDAVYGAWCATLLVASRVFIDPDIVESAVFKCTQLNSVHITLNNVQKHGRGVLLRGNGQPHCANSISSMTGVSSDAIEKMLPMALELRLLTTVPFEVFNAHTPVARSVHSSSTLDVRQIDKERIRQIDSYAVQPVGLHGAGEHSDAQPCPSCGSLDTEYSSLLGECLKCAGDSEPGYAFEIFWQAYPRKQNKKRARDVWIRKKLDASIDRIVQSIHEHERGEQWRRKVIPHASTWLNGERWLDSVEPDPDAPIPMTLDRARELLDNE